MEILFARWTSDKLQANVSTFAESSQLVHIYLVLTYRKSSFLLTFSRPSRASKQRKWPSYDLLGQWLVNTNLGGYPTAYSKPKKFEFTAPKKSNNDPSIQHLKAIYDSPPEYKPKKGWCLSVQWYGPQYRNNQKIALYYQQIGNFHKVMILSLAMN